MYQCIILLEKIGLEDEAKIILRCMLEKLILMVAIEKDDKNLEKINNNYLFECKKVIQKANRGEKGLEEIKEKNLSLTNSMKVAKNTKICEFAKLAEMEEEYNLVYNVLSNYVHNDLQTLDEINIYEDDEISEISVAPCCNDFKIIMHTAINFMVRALAIIAKYFKIDEEQYEHLTKKINF